MFEVPVTYFDVDKYTTRLLQEFSKSTHTRESRVKSKYKDVPSLSPEIPKTSPKVSRTKLRKSNPN